MGNLFLLIKLCEPRQLTDLEDAEGEGNSVLGRHPAIHETGPPVAGQTLHVARVVLGVIVHVVLA